MSFYKNNQCVYSCHICHEQGVILLEEFASLVQVTSDCRPWKRDGKLGVCRSCGFVQKIADKAFLSDCEEIYRNYAVYYQADGQEQKVFEQSGLSLSRSESILVQLLKKKHEFPVEGTLLDIGCGNGNFLNSFSRLCPYWALSGLEFDEKNRCTIEEIPHVETFYTCDLKDVSGRFDMISMIHCLEHMVDPVRYLQQVKEKLNSKGFVLIEIPDHTQNPFDLVVADHCTHFDVNTIQSLLENSGFEAIIISTEFVPKEITVLARKSDNGKCVATVAPVTTVDCCYDRLIKSIAWLKEIIASASCVANRHTLGIFGTSIAGVWLYNEIPGQVSFFVEEDLARVDKFFMNRKVYHSSNLPDKGSVFIPLPYGIARGISDRLKIYGDRFVTPPQF